MAFAGAIKSSLRGFRMSMKFTLPLGLIVLTLAPQRITAEEFEAVLAEGQHTYFPSEEGPGIDGCEPDNFQCDFSVSGSVRMDTDGRTLTFPTVDFKLNGNEAIQENPPFLFAPITSMGFEDLFTGVELTRVTLEGRENVYQLEPGLRPRMEVEFVGSEILISGFRDNRPVDGDGHSFSLKAVPVPEPTTILMLLLSAPFISSRLSRGR